MVGYSCQEEYEMKREDYLATWQELGSIQVTMVEKSGRCSHELGDTFLYKGPYEKPLGVVHCAHARVGPLYLAGDARLPIMGRR